MNNDDNMDKLIDDFEIEAEQELLDDARNEKDQELIAAILVLQSPDKPNRILTWDVEYGDEQGINFITETKKSIENHHLLKTGETLDIVVGMMDIAALKYRSVNFNQLQ